MWLVFIHDVNAVADALGVTKLNSLADVKAKTGRRDEAGSDFACVQGDMHARIDAMQIIEHEHLTVVFGHGEIAVFGHDEVDPDDGGMSGVELRLDGLEAEKGLREDLLGRKAAEDLIEKTDVDLAGRGGRGRSTVFYAVASLKGIGELLAIGSDDVAETFGEELFAKS